MSSARSRQQKRKARETRTPGLWRQGASTVPRQDKPVKSKASPTGREEHGIRDEMVISWRVFSGLIVGGLSLVLMAFFLTDFFYVRSIELNGAQYLDEAEVFRYADIAENHIFWVSPDTVRQNILDASPLIADARVQIGWPPDMVRITVEERQPAMQWSQGGVRVLLDIQGNILRAPREDEQFPDLLHVIADNTLPDPRVPGDPVPVDVVAGSLQLRNLIAGLPTLRYNAKNGLGFREIDGSWDVWLGTGTDMTNKLRVYETLRDDLLGRGVVPVVINVADLDAVYYCGSIEFCDE